MADFGGTGAQAIKDAIDALFRENGRSCVEHFLEKLIACTSDGASVNFGRKEGLLQKMINDGRDWLVKFHCVNHRVELAVKNAFDNSLFNGVDKEYLGIFNLLKNSGAIKSEVKTAAMALDISFYTLPKITGTRFVSHRKKAFTHFLNMWPALIVAFDNTLANRPHIKCETKAKIRGFLKYLRNFEFVMLTCAYLDLLEKITPASLVFERNHLLVTEIKPSLKMTYLELEDLVDSAGTDDEFLDSHLARFEYVEDDNGETIVSAHFVKHNHMLKSPVNRENTQIVWGNFTHIGDRARQRASNAKKDVATDLIALLKDRFVSFDDPIFESMEWIEPKNWEDSPENEIEQLDRLVQHFSTPLSLTKFDQVLVPREWRRLRNHVKAHFARDLMADQISTLRIWEMILKFKKLEFPNICILAELVLSLAGSNSAVERSFSMLTTILTNRRLKMSHETLELLILIRCNDKVWSEEERKEIIERAADIHLQKNRKLMLDGENVEKRQKVNKNTHDSSDDNTPSSTEEASGSELDEDL
jgi:hypothetical protein